MQQQAVTVNGWRGTYLSWLCAAFALFNAVRVLTYLPTLWAIDRSASSDQHSLLTWGAWLMANLTTGLWQYEQRRRVDPIVWSSWANAAMCGAVLVLIAWYRIR